MSLTSCACRPCCSRQRSYARCVTPLLVRPPGSARWSTKPPSQRRMNGNASSNAADDIARSFANSVDGAAGAWTKRASNGRWRCDTPGLPQPPEWTSDHPIRLLCQHSAGVELHGLEAPPARLVHEVRGATGPIRIEVGVVEGNEREPARPGREGGEHHPEVVPLPDVVAGLIGDPPGQRFVLLQYPGQDAVAEALIPLDPVGPAVLHRRHLELVLWQREEDLGGYARLPASLM